MNLLQIAHDMGSSVRRVKRECIPGGESQLEWRPRVVVSVNKDGPPKYDFDGTHTFSNKGND
jgi:hypothetical protein